MRIQIRFYEELNEYLPASWRKRDLIRDIIPDQKVQHILDTFQVPASAVDLILVNGTPVDFSHVLANNDRLSVYPVFESFDITEASVLPDRPLRSLKFLAADHLGKLTKYLRMLGFDATCRKGRLDRLIAAARSQNRILLSRSTRLMQHPGVTHAFRVESELPDRQLLEVVRRFDLAEQIRPLSRCLCCNALLETIEQQELRGRIDPEIYQSQKKFQICPECHRIYWPGSHAARMTNWLRLQMFPSL